MHRVQSHACTVMHECTQHIHTHTTLVMQQNIFANFQRQIKRGLNAEHETLDWRVGDFRWHDRLCTGA